MKKLKYFVTICAFQVSIRILITVGSIFCFSIEYRKKYIYLFTEPCVDFLRKQADALNLPVLVSYPVDKEHPVSSFLNL